MRVFRFFRCCKIKREGHGHDGAGDFFYATAVVLIGGANAFFPVDFLNDEGNGAVACDVTSCSEGVHRDIQCNHQRLLLGGEAEYR